MNNFYFRIQRRIFAAIETLFFQRRSAVTKKKTLLLLRVDSIGDYILFRNFIEAIKSSSKYKDYQITLAGNLWWKDLSEELDKKHIHEFIWIDYLKMNKFSYRFKKYREIHSKGFEVLVAPSYSRDRIGDNIIRNSGAAEKTGYDGDLNNLTLIEKIRNDKAFTRLIPSASKYSFEFYRNKFFFESLVNDTLPVSKPTIDYNKGSKEDKIIICPGAKDLFRRWSPVNFVELCKMLQNKFPGLEFCICGAASDSVFAKEIMEKSDIQFSDLTGKLNLVQLLNVMAEAKIVVTNDSGPFHIAVALGKNSVCISNGNNYGRFTPYPVEMNTKSKVVYPDEVMAFSEMERLERFCKEVKDVDINKILPSKVFQAINDLI